MLYHLLVSHSVNFKESETINHYTQTPLLNDIAHPPLILVVEWPGAELSSRPQKI